jgi:trk system potassium uptake protein TrkH
VSRNALHVDWRAALALSGRVLVALAVPLAVPLVLSLHYAEDPLPFLAAIVVTVLVGGVCVRAHDDPGDSLGHREGFLMVSLTWLAVALVGTVPYLVAGHGTASTLAHPVNALFESMSGFTTTGATVMGDISFEQHSKSLLLWRQLTQWLGGMGIVVLALAILPELSVGGAQLMDAEAPGPGIEKITPRIAETARVLWLAYLGFTLLEAAILYGLHLGGLADGMTLYMSVAHALTTLPTGGFSPAAQSIEAFSAAVQWVIIPFMAIAGTNFALMWRAVSGEPGNLFSDTEFRSYLSIVGLLALAIGGMLFAGAGLEPAGTAGASYDAAYLDALRDATIGNVERVARDALFQSLAIVTTTGYASVDFNAWSTPVQYFMLAAMFIGGSAGSTGGSVKVIRWLVVGRALKRELYSAVHPEAVSPVRLGGRVIDEDVVHSITSFTMLYVVCFFLGTALVALDAARVGLGYDHIELLSAVASTLGNVGPGFGNVGPMNSYLGFPDTTKLFMVFLMWVGRLEILPVFVLLTKAYWTE